MAASAQGTPATRFALLRHTDLILAAGVALIVGMLVVPMPAILLDVFITCNLALGLLILLVAISVMNPGYMNSMFQGWGYVWLAGSAFSVFFGVMFINRMVKIDV